MTVYQKEDISKGIAECLDGSTSASCIGNTRKSRQSCREKTDQQRIDSKPWGDTGGLLISTGLGKKRGSVFT